VSSDERDLFDGEACLKKAARRFVAQIVKMQIIDLQFLAGDEMLFLRIVRCKEKSCLRECSRTVLVPR